MTNWPSRLHARRPWQIFAWHVALVIWVALAPSASAKVTAAHAILISIDGLRADAITQKLAPRLADLKRRGAWAPKARCVSPSVTVPNHVSMLTGVVPSKHGFLRNQEGGYPPGTYVSGTLLEIAHAAGRTTALYVSKEKLRILARPEVLNRQVITNNGSSEEIVSAFLKDLSVSPAGGWDLTVIHLVEPDAAGHKKGWMSNGYKQAVGIVDRHVGRIVDALEERHLFGETFLLVTADHGGIGRSHILNAPQVFKVPWIAAGPAAITAGARLERAVGPCDVAPTLLAVLDLPIPQAMQGSSVF